MTSKANTGALPPLSRTARRVLLAVVAVAGLAELSYVIVNLSAMPVYISARGLDARWIGICATAYLVVEGVLKSPFGILGDRIGRRLLIALGPAISAFTALATPFVRHPGLLIALRVLDGMGAAALWPSAFSLIGDHVPEARRASAMSLFNVAYLIGVAFGPAIGGGLNDWTRIHLNLPQEASKDASFYVAAVLFAITAATALLVLPRTGTPIHDPTGMGPGVEGGLSWVSFKAMIRRLPMSLLMAFVTFFGIGLVMAYAKVFVMEEYHVTETRYGLMLIVPALVVALSSIPLGTIGDRIGNARAVRLGVVTCTTGYWLAVAVQNTTMLIVCGCLIGMGFVIAFPAWMAQVSSDCEPGLRGAAVGAVGTAQGLGAIVGVALSAPLWSLANIPFTAVRVTPHTVPFLGCGIMLIAASAISFLTFRGPGRPVPR